MTKAQRAHIIALIGKHTDYDTATVRIGRDGAVSAIKANLPMGAPRLFVAWVADFDGGANPFAGRDQ